MILSDRDIIKAVEESRIEVEPPIKDVQYQPASLDVRMGANYWNVNTGESYEDVEEIVIEPFEFYLGHTMDKIKLPDDLSAMVSGRSSFGRKGLIIHATAGWIDASFGRDTENGTDITLEIFNLSQETIRIKPGTRIGQLVFFQMSSPAKIPYNEKEDAKYNDQEGPTESRVD